MTILSILSLTLSLTCITKENYNIEETQKQPKNSTRIQTTNKRKKEKKKLYITTQTMKK